jgi:hypothetical protein
MGAARHLVCLVGTDANAPQIDITCAWGCERCNRARMLLGRQLVLSVKSMPIEVVYKPPCTSRGLRRTCIGDCHLVLSVCQTSTVQPPHHVRIASTPLSPGPLRITSFDNAENAADHGYCAGGAAWHA